MGIFHRDLFKTNSTRAETLENHVYVVFLTSIWGYNINCVQEFGAHPKVFLGPLREFLEFGDGFGHFR